jgi:hypothetical protein
MTLFTVEGLLDARVTAAHASGAEAGEGGGARDEERGSTPGAERGGAEGGARAAAVDAVRRAYLRWLDTQQHQAPPPAGLPHQTGLLREEAWLYSRRAPGNACLSGLHRWFPGPSAWGEPGPVNPDSKGCGTVMRSAPFGLVNRVPREAFELAAICAQITHGHPTGYLAAGAFAAIITHLMAGQALEPAVHQAMELLAEYPGHEETTAALRAAVRLAGGGGHSPVAASTARWRSPPWTGPCCCRSTTRATATRPARCAATSWAPCTAPPRCPPPGWRRWRAGTRSNASPPSWPDHVTIRVDVLSAEQEWAHA